MKSKGVRLLLLSIVLGAVVVTGLTVFLQRQSLLEWWYLRQFHRTKHTSEKLAAIAKLTELRSRRAVPLFLELTIQPGDLSKPASDAIIEFGADAFQPLLRALCSSETPPMVRNNAAVFIVGLRTSVSNLAVRLAEEYDAGVPDGISLVLMNIFCSGQSPPPSIAQVLFVVANKEKESRRHFLMTLAGAAAQCEPARTVCERMITDASPEIRSTAVTLASMVVRQSGKLLEALLQAAGDSDPDVRLLAIEHLSEVRGADDERRRVFRAAIEDVKMAPLVAPYVAASLPEVLVEAADHEDRTIALAAIDALAAAGIRSGVPAIRARLSASPDESFSSHVLDALLTMGEAASEVAPEVRAILTAETGELAHQAAVALGEIGAAPEVAVPALLKALEGDDAVLRSAAALSLGSFPESAEKVIPALSAASRDPLIADAVIQAIGRIGEAAVPELTRRLDDPDSEVRWVTAAVLGRMGHVAQPAAAKLCALLKDQEDQVRYTAAKAVAEIDPPVAVAVPALQPLLRDENSQIRLTAAHALLDIDSATFSAALPVFVAALREDDLGLADRLEMVETFDALGEPAIPALVECLRDTESLVRLQAAAALKSLALESSAVVPALGELLKSDNATAREAATELLKELRPE